MYDAKGLMTMLFIIFFFFKETKYCIHLGLEMLSSWDNCECSLNAENCITLYITGPVPILYTDFFAMFCYYRHLLLLSWGPIIFIHSWMIKISRWILFCLVNFIKTVSGKSVKACIKDDKDCILYLNEEVNYVNSHRNIKM